MKSIVMYTAAAMSSNADVEISAESPTSSPERSYHGEVQCTFCICDFLAETKAYMINFHCKFST